MLSKQPQPLAKPAEAQSCTQKDYVAIMIDKSLSMKGDQFNGAKSGAVTFLEGMKANPGNQAAIISFKRNDRTEANFANTLSQDETTVQNLAIDNDQNLGTCIECALRNVQKQFTNAPAGVRKIAILLSDGNANYYLDKQNNVVDDTDNNGQHARDQAKNAADALKALGVTIYTITLEGSGHEHESFMAGLASNGVTYPSKTGSDTKTYYQNIWSVSKPCPGTTGTISGCVYRDADRNGRFSSDESVSDQPFQVALSGSTVAPTYTNGCYAFKNVPNGSYALQLQPLAQTIYTFPPLRTYTFTVNSATCSVSPNNPAGNQWTCANGSIGNLNFGLASPAWVQLQDFNARDDNGGFSDPIPASSACSTYMVRDGVGGTPGMVMSASGSNDFGNGSASSRNWQVTGSSIRSTTALETSYNAMLQTLSRNGKAATPLNSYCNQASCSLTESLASAAYRSSGNLTVINSSLATKKVLVLVPGDLHIAGSVKVAKGAFLMFVVKGNIYVESSVGAGSGAHACAGTTNTQVDGVYSTDSSFIVNGGTACPTGDRELNMAGSIVTNAGLKTNGNFSNNRSLCGANAQYPAFTIQPRLDFLLSMPTYLLHATSVWQEVSP